jgi:hypothetical protein
VGFVRAAGFNGSYHFSPLVFQGFTINYICLRNHGKFVGQEIIPDYTGDNTYLDAYRTFLEESGIVENNHGTVISVPIYKTCANLYAFDLTHFHSSNTDLEDPVSGCNLSLEVRFADNEDNLILICYIESDSYIKLKSNDEIDLPID